MFADARLAASRTLDTLALVGEPETGGEFAVRESGAILPRRLADDPVSSVFNAARSRHRRRSGAPAGNR
jgi:hypothetical protein